MKTSTIPAGKPQWLLIDANGKNLGRLAVQAATLLRGKHRPTYSPHQLCGDHVIIINAGKLALPPKKGLRKTYYRHTGRVGNLQVTRLDEMMEKRPTEVIERAVKGMLPTNRLRVQMLKRLHVFAEGEHPYEAQKPSTL